MKITAIVSGGMDSVTLAHKLRHDFEHDELHMLSFDYGQRHGKELQFAEQCAKNLDAQWTLVNVDFLADLFAESGSHSSLINGDFDVPHGHYEEESMKQTVVPNRNMIMLSIAAGVAVSEGAKFVATGVHAGDHAIYPDCRPEFIRLMSVVLHTANEGFCDSGFYVHAPFMNWKKYQIASLGNSLHVDWTETWSCYEGGEYHCGQCGTCVERREAFSLAGLVDPTEYARL